MDDCLDTITKEALDNPDSKIKVAISAASDVDENFVLSSNNFPIREQKRGRNSSFEIKTELEKKLHQVNVDSSRINLTVENDAEMQLTDVALKFKLKKGSRALGISLGTGFNLKDGINYKGNGEFTEVKSAPKIMMPELDKYQNLEGPQRAYSSSDSKGSAAAYITGGHNENPEHGPKGTLSHLFKLMESSDKEDKRELQKALKLLIPTKGIRARLLAVIGLGNRARRKALEKSDLTRNFKKSQELSNEAIEAAAKSNDKLALALLIFTAKRTADVLKTYLEKDSKLQWPEVIYLAGGFANGIYNSDNKHIKQVREVLEKEIKKFSEAQLELHDPELDGAIEFLKLKQ